LPSIPPLHRDDTLKEFAAVARIASIPMLIAVHPSLPARTIKDLVAFARTRPGELTYASPGSGTTLHLAMETFKGLAKADIIHVPYAGGAQAVSAVLGGHATILILPVADIAPHIAVGKLRGLAVTSLMRAEVLKEVPTLAESGFSGFDMSIWFGTWVPAATPREVVTRLSAEMLRALQLPEVKDGLVKQGYSTAPLRAEEFGAFFRGEVRRYEKIARDINFKID
jgi:tripartite-type tricarboxylate transporter receptor subunit TctC